MEGLDQVQGGMSEGHAVQGSPEVDDVALLGAGGIEALEDVLAQVDAEGAAACVAAVDGTGPAPLQAAAA